jgi:hypothetical protein
MMHLAVDGVGELLYGYVINQEELTQMTDKQLRARILEFAERCVVPRYGFVLAYGVIPNTNKRGWYSMGHKDDLKREYTYEMEARA